MNPFATDGPNLKAPIFTPFPTNAVAGSVRLQMDGAPIYGI